jgi:hypothetical protein
VRCIVHVLSRNGCIIGHEPGAQRRKIDGSDPFTSRGPAVMLVV